MLLENPTMFNRNKYYVTDVGVANKIIEALTKDGWRLVQKEPFTAKVLNNIYSGYYLAMEKQGEGVYLEVADREYTIPDTEFEG